MPVTLNASTASGLVVTPDNSGVVAIQNNGTTGLNIDASGRVTMPLQPTFYGYRDAGNVTATSVVLHNNIRVNVGSCYNASTGVFTCPIAGVYEIFVGGHGENSQPVVLQIQLNGTSITEEYANGASYPSVTAFAITSCAVNDQIRSVVSTGTMWGGGPSGLRMSVKLIG